ncbi:MAG TPA: TonB-dependent receptor [Bryobacteraceae bacterium]|nr:TonB-dependent receptor [Bryobacteraceae bacterium]
MKLTWLLTGVFLAACAVYAQTETGQITGTILDPTGATIAGATVRATMSATGTSRSTTSATDGNYTIADLQPGEYTVAVTATGFNQQQQRLTVSVGARIGQDFHLEVGSTSTVVEVTETAVHVDTETQTLSQVVTENEIKELPNLTRNPYQFVALAGNVSDVGLGTRGAGFSINGQREASTNILLDGGSNNDEFNGNIGQQVPLDAVQEFSVMTSNFTAEYGRASGGIVNVVSKSGTNDFHGTAYEFNRVSRFSSNTFQNNADGIAKSPFVRNQFGYSVGGPVKKNKLFFFSSTEWTRVRSNAESFAWVPTPDLIAQTPANVQNFFQTLGQLRTSASAFGTVNRADLTNLLGGDPCAGQACASLPSNLPLFTHIAYTVPTDAGGGFPQNTWDTFQRVDYNISDKTQLYGRYALYSSVNPAGVLSNSPYANYDLGETFYNHNFLLSLIHTFSPTWISESKVVFNRLTNLQQGLTSRGLVPTMYANTIGLVTIGADSIAFPGYNPFTPGNGGAFGGPQNIIQFNEDISHSWRAHSIRFGGSFDYVRDNRTYAAYQTAVDALANDTSLGSALDGLLAGQFSQIKVAVDPQGKFPCAVTPDNCKVTLPVTSPNFSRSNRFREGALYAQDSWKVRPRFTVNLGLRWEYFGVQHDKHDRLDANWYAPGIGFADDQLGLYLRNGSMQLAPNSPVGGLWASDWKDFGPRVGFAWDVFGNGKTSVRGGYGIGYERNFGNVTYNLIQNPPNYAVLDVSGPVTTDNFGPLAGSGGSLPLPRVGARIVDPHIKTAYAHMWNASIEHQFARNVLWAVEYSGSKGVDLYAITYPNQNGFGNFILGDPCTASAGCSTQPNPGWGINVGYRGNEGFSIYHGLNNRFTMRNFMGSGVDLIANYTWSHAIDNLSSTFFEAGGQGIAGQYGQLNLTINNGDFVFGLLDPYHPKLDRGDAEFDIRQRLTMAATWRIPTGNLRGFAHAVLGGWSFNPIFTARTGQPFSIFDSAAGVLPLNTPRATFAGPVPVNGNGLIATATPDVYHYLTIPDSLILHEPMSMAPGTKWPSNMTGRDAFRGPGWWDLDAGLYKDTKITERFSIQLRAETFNLFNHANLYVNGTTADVGTSNAVNACFGCTGSTYDRRHLQLAVKLIF